MDAADDNVESGFSEEESNSNQQVDSKITERNVSEDSEKSNEQKQMLYAVVRLYVGKGEVNIININKIRDFDSAKNTFPYNAYVATSIDEDEQIAYEPASVLAISNDETELKSRSTRWPKPNKRRSTVVYELAQEALKKGKSKEKANARKISSKNHTTSKKKDPLLTAKQDSQDMIEKLNVLDKKKLIFDTKGKLPDSAESSNIEDVTNKDEIIARLTRELEEIRGNQSWSGTLASSGTSDSAAKIMSPVSSTVTGGNLSPVSPSLISGKSRKRITKEKLSPMSPSLISGMSRKRISNIFSFSKQSKRQTDSSVSPAATSRNKQRTQSPVSPAVTPGKQQMTQSPVSPAVTPGKQQMTHSPILSSVRTKRVNENSVCTPVKRQRTRPSIRRLRILSNDIDNDPSINASNIPYSSLRLNAVAGPSGVNKKISKNNSEKKSSKKKSQYQKKIKACSYDSDDYNNSDSEKKEKLTKWEHEQIDEKTGFMSKKSMFHIHYGVSVPYRNWKNAIAAKTSYGFLRELVVPHLGSLNEFVKKAVQISRTSDSNDRLELTPKKKEALKRGYVQFLIEKRIIPYKVETDKEKKKRDARINKFGRELGIIMSQERSKLNVNSDNQNKSDTDLTECSDQDRSNVESDD